MIAPIWLRPNASERWSRRTCAQVALVEVRLILTRPANQTQVWSSGLQAQGHEVVSWPLIVTQAVSPAQAVDLAWRDLGEFRALMFVSAPAVSHFFARRPPDSTSLAVRCWATGPGTRRALLLAGVDPGLIDTPAPDAAQFDTEHLWPIVAHQAVSGQTVAIVRGTDEQAGLDIGSVVDPGVGRDWLALQLQQAGVRVRWIVAYQRSAPLWDTAQRALVARAATDGSVWVLSSSQAVMHLHALIPKQDWSQARAVATHERIAAALRAMGWGRVQVSRPDVPGLLQGLVSLESHA